jgi:hypothetical protein
MADDLDPIDGHAFRPEPDNPEGCGHVEDGEVCGWPERDHLTSTDPTYRPDAAYHRMLRGQS